MEALLTLAITYVPRARAHGGARVSGDACRPQQELSGETAVLCATLAAT
jgi:hypothetical protein